MSKKNDILKPSRVHFQMLKIIKVTCPIRFKLSVWMNISQQISEHACNQYSIILFNE